MGVKGQSERAQRIGAAIAWRFLATLGMTTGLGLTSALGLTIPPAAWRLHERIQHEFPSSAGIPAKACDTLTFGMLTGDVRRLDGSPAIGAQVSVFWSDVSLAGGTPRVVQQTMRLTTTVGANGVYRACNIPLATNLLVVASASDSSRGAAVHSLIDNGNVRFLDIVLGDGSTRALSGHVAAANRHALGGARVSLMGSAGTVVTDTNGHFVVRDAPTGSRMLEVVALGYAPAREQVNVGGANESVEITMLREAVLLDSVKTVATAKTPDIPLHRSFENRRQNGIGYFVSAAQIADMHVISTDEILRRVPSVRIIVKHTQSGDSVMVASTRGRVSLETGGAEKPVCTLDIFIDGRRSDVSDIQMIQPSLIHGIEVHSVATMPPEYHSSQCGAVLVWTK